MWAYYTRILVCKSEHIIMSDDLCIALRWSFPVLASIVAIAPGAAGIRKTCGADSESCWLFLFADNEMFVLRVKLALMETSSWLIRPLWYEDGQRSGDDVTAPVDKICWSFRIHIDSLLDIAERQFWPCCEKCIYYALTLRSPNAKASA